MQNTRQKSTIVLAISIMAFVLFFGVSNWFRHVNLYTSQFDMGNMDQVMWQSLNGRWWQMNSPIGPDLHLRTAVHADYLLLSYLPFYALFPDPRTMLILQVIVVASGAIPLYWLARKRLGDMAGAWVAALYLLYPTLQWAVTFDVHAVVLVAPLLLWAWWAMSEKRWWIYGLTAAAAMLGKEEIGLLVAAMGVYWIWRRKQRAAAAASIVVGMAWTALMLAWSIPSARNIPGHFALGYYAEYGGSYGSIVSNIFLQPWQTITDVFSPGGQSLWRALLAPVGLLALLGWPVLLVALPELGINLLSSNANQQTIFFQYQSAIIPFIFLATIDGWVRLRRWFDRWSKQARFVQTVRWGIAGLMVVSVWFWSPLPLTKHHGDAVKVFSASPYRSDVNMVQKSLQSTDRVVATNNLVPQFSRRDHIWGFPEDLDQADAIVVLEGGVYELASQIEVRRILEDLRRNPAFELVHQRDQFWYFRRK